MPWLLAALPAIAAIGGTAAAGTTIGLDIANAGNKTVTPTTPAPTPPNAQQLEQQKALISQQLPNIVGATSGLANPSYDALIAQILSGTAGQSGANASAGAATGQAFTPANSQPTNAAVQGQPVNLSDFINSFSG
jgi:hypothetical protein